jgi:hypothetical protein
MKKFLTIMLASMIIFAMTAPAMAMHFDMSGKFRVRNWVLGNYINGDSSSEFTDQRLRLSGNWGISENVALKFRADVLEGLWGSTTGAFGPDPGIDPATGAALEPEFFTTTNKAQIAFDQVYAVVALPGTGVTATVGRQPVNWGTGMAAASDNRDRLKLIYKGPVTLGLLYDKFQENYLANSMDDAIQDNQGLGAVALGNVGGFKTGLLFYHLSNKAVPGSDTQQNLVDVFFTGQAGAVSVKADVGYIFGETDAGGVTTDRSGLAAYLGLGFNAGMANLGLEVAYARGDDPNTADENEGVFNHDYHGPFHSIILYHNFDYSGFAGTVGGGADRGVNNALAVKASVTAKPSEKLSLTGAVVWAQRDEVMAGMDDDLGVELDAIAVYNIYDNVAYTLGVGYLMAGDAFGDIDDPWGMLNRIQVNF